MDVALPSFILGYHGCDAAVAQKVVCGEATLRVSGNDYDWLGDGIYFWEHGAQRAHDFAVEMARRPHPSRQNITAPDVVGAIIDLRYCLNLLDERFIEIVKRAYVSLEIALTATKSSMPRNMGGTDLVDRKLDCAVIRSLHQRRQEDGELPFDTVRAAFFEGGPLYENAGFAARNHIQVCVRDQRCIHGYFRPLDDKGKPITFR